MSTSHNTISPTNTLDEWKLYLDEHPQVAGLFAIIALIVVIFIVSKISSSNARLASKPYSDAMYQDVLTHVKTGDFTIDETGRANEIVSSFTSYFNYYGKEAANGHPDTIRLMPAAAIAPYMAMAGAGMLFLFCIGYLIWFFYHYYDKVFGAVGDAFVFMTEFGVKKIGQEILILLKQLKFAIPVVNVVVDPFSNIQISNMSFKDRTTQWFYVSVKKPFSTEADILYRDIMSTVNKLNAKIYSIPSSLLNFVKAPFGN